MSELSGRYRLEDYRRNLTHDHQVGQTQAVTNILNAPRYTDSEKARYREVEIAAHIDVPLLKDGQFLALLAVHQSTPRQWTDNEVKQVEETAERTWAEVERARAEAALRQSEEQTRNVLESIAEAFFALDENWQFTYVNPSAEALLDRTPGDLVGKNIWQEYSGLAGNELAQIHWSAMHDRVAASLTAFYPDHDRWYEVRTYPASNGISVYFRDVTSQVQAEEALRQSEARFRRVFECEMVPMGMYTKVGGVIEANNSLLNLIGYTQQELKTGQINWQALTPPEYRSLDEKALSEIEVRGVSAPYEKVYLHKDGRRIPILIGAALFLEDASSGVFFAIDLTDRKQAEAEREQLLQREQAAREEAERANRIKDEFLAVLSHELRSPLNPILGWTHLLQNGKLDETRQREALATIERNAKLQAQLIEDLLDISRIMQGKLSLTAAPVSLAYVIAAALETVRLAAEAKHIQITLDLAPNIAPLSGDTARLQQVVWNLLTNAVKFTPNGGQVTVELRQLEQAAQMRVIDTGKGIQPQFLPHVFEYFRQEDGSTTRRFGGLGLGLAIVRQIVEMHGGTVWAESEGENRGAIFTVQLPLSPQVRPSEPEPPRDSVTTGTPLSHLQILLVDDETDTREFQAIMLEQSGATVTAVASGLEALQALDRFMPDLLISDVGMAEMDGYTLIEQIRSREALRSHARPTNQSGTLPAFSEAVLPAIALTAYAGTFAQQKAIESGFQAHLTKPVEPEALVRAIVSLLRS